MPVADGLSATQRKRALWLTALFATLSALAFALSFPLSETFVAGWPLAFVWGGLLSASVWHAPSARALALCVAPPFFVAYFAHQSWMMDVTALGMPVLAAYLTMWTVVLALVLRLLSGSSRDVRVPFALTLPVSLVAMEFLRGDLVCTGYAWFFTAHPLVEWESGSQIAALGGGWLLSALAALVSGAATDIILFPRRRMLGAIFAVICVVASTLYGNHALIVAQEELAQTIAGEVNSPRRPSFLLVQTNLPMSNKLSWEPEAQIDDFISFATLSLEGAARAREQHRSVDAVVWPETMLPGFGLEKDTLQNLKDGGYYPGFRYYDGMCDLARRVGAPFIVGSPAYLALRLENGRFAWDHQFNSAYLVDANGTHARTDKIFLTPFGETMPIISNWDWLEQQLLAIGADGMTFDLDSADAPTRFVLKTTCGEITVGVPICFEITAPWASRRIAFDGGTRAVSLLVNISNDGWFSESLAGRRQHVQVAQLRAIELATPVLRCANTGMSASIDAQGRVRELLPPTRDGTLLVRPMCAQIVPLSALVGDGVAWCALIVTVVGSAAALRKRRAMLG